MKPSYRSTPKKVKKKRQWSRKKERKHALDQEKKSKIEEKTITGKKIGSRLRNDQEKKIDYINI